MDRIIKYFFGLLLILFIYLTSAAQNKISYNYAPVSMGVLGGVNISYLEEDTLETKKATLPVWGLSISLVNTKKLSTKFELLQTTNGKNIITPNTKIRNLYVDIQVIELYKPVDFLKAGIGLRYSIPLYALEITPNDIKQTFNLSNQLNPVIELELSMNNNLDFCVLYSIPIAKSSFNLLQFGFNYWILKAYKEK